MGGDGGEIGAGGGAVDELARRGSSVVTAPRTTGFRHDALLYDGVDDLVARLAPFVAAGVAQREAVLVVLDPPKIDRLRAALGPDAEGVRFEDMGAVGSNPSRLIPVWRDFVEETGGARPDVRRRGVGEPVGPTRDHDELDECLHHEALLNVEFGDDPDLWLACPYDRSALDPHVLDLARRTHPRMTGAGGDETSPLFVADDAGALVAPLSPAPVDIEHPFGSGSFRDLRSYVTAEAEAAGLAPAVVQDLVLAVSEVATNSVLHGGGRGILRVWLTDDALVCEITDRGSIDHALVGRRRPSVGQPDGRGLWIVNQVCDFVQLRSGPDGTVVRLHMKRPLPAAS